VFVQAPRLALVSAHDHLHALKQDAARVVVHMQRTLVTEHIPTINLNEEAEESFQPAEIKRAYIPEHERTDIVAPTAKLTSVGTQRVSTVSANAAAARRLSAPPANVAPMIQISVVSMGV
jgi:UDP-N-acetylmuramoylalanine-D-glutamate ligase